MKILSIILSMCSALSLGISFLLTICPRLRRMLVNLISRFLSVNKNAESLALLESSWLSICSSIRSQEDDLMEFKKAYDPVVVEDSVPKAAYDHLQPTYALDTSLDAEAGTLKKSGVRDVYAEIQAAAPGTVLSDSVQKFGVSKFIEKSQQLPPEAFGDATFMPKNIIEAMEVVNRAESGWNALPPEVRRAFGNNMKNFVDAFDNGSYADVLASLTKKEDKADAES